MEKRTLIPLMPVEDFYNDLQTMIVDSVNSCLKHHKKSSNNNSTTEEEILNVKQASSLLGLAVPTIYALTSNRTLPHSKRGKKLYFNKTELIAWVQSGKRKTVSDLKLEALNIKA